MRPASQFPKANHFPATFPSTKPYRNLARATEIRMQRGLQTLPTVVTILNPSESLANAALVSHALVQKLHFECHRPVALREDEDSKPIDFIRPDGVTSSSQRSDETIRHEQDRSPHKSGFQPAVQKVKIVWYRKRNGDVFIQVGTPHVYGREISQKPCVDRHPVRGPLADPDLMNSEK
jgi:hypothetical protein